MTAARALLASPRARLGAGAALAGAALLAGLSGSDLGPGAGRAALAVGALALLAAWAGRPRPAGADVAPRLEVAARAALGRDAGLALVVADGRRLVVSFGPGGPRLVADLGGEATPLALRASTPVPLREPSARQPLRERCAGDQP